MTDKPVGLDRYLQKGWLDLALELTEKGCSIQDARPFLEDRLKEELQGAEARKKTITVLNRVWIHPRSEFLSFRNEALTLSRMLSPEERVALHWGLLQLNYPFFYTVTAHLGRLLQLQGQTTRAQIRRRVIEAYGERTSVERSIGMALQSLVHWHILKEENKVILAGTPIELSPSLLFWLARILLQGRESKMLSLTGLYQDPSLFPFILPVLSVREFENQGFEILRQASGEELLMMKKLYSLPE